MGHDLVGAYPQVRNGLILHQRNNLPHASSKASMKTLLRLSVLTFLLALGASPCFGMISIVDVSKERAKEMGMEVRALGAGPEGVWVEVEFELKGELKSFNRVNLEISDGKKLVLSSALLPEERAKPGHVLVVFTAGRAQLDKINLTVVVGIGDVGYGVRVKEFVDLAKIR
jgi:hypothetical protein